MKGYGQFCPMALATEIIGERWTLLILRELMLGSSRFNDIHRGVPRISPTLLTQRLRALEVAGIVERRDAGGYGVTEAGAELWPMIETLAVWGKTWLPATLSEDEADPDLIMWDLHRRMELERLPQRRTTIHFIFTDQPKAKRDRWILCSPEGAEYCITDPGFEADLYVTTDSRTITWVWYGDIPLKTALDEGLILLDGPARLCAAFPSWLRLNLLAQVPRRHPAAPRPIGGRLTRIAAAPAEGGGTFLGVRAAGRRAWSLDLLGGDGQAELLLQRPGEGAAHRVRLPAGGLDDLRDGGALLAAEHRDQLRLLGALAGSCAERAVSRAVGAAFRGRPRRFGAPRPAPRRRPWARPRPARRRSWCPR